MQTEMGKIAQMLQCEKQGRTPLEKSLDKLGKIISAFVLAVTAVIFIMGRTEKGIRHRAESDIVAPYAPLALFNPHAFARKRGFVAGKRVALYYAAVRRYYVPLFQKYTSLNLRRQG